MASDVLLTLGSKAGRRRVRLSEYLSAQADEDAARQANAWIKSLRHARVDGVTFRERFTYRDDSLWWFAELFLHKERAILSLFRTIAATTRLLDREAPHSVQIDVAGAAQRLVVAELTRSRGIYIDTPAIREASAFHVLRLDARSTALMLAAVASPGRPGRIRPAAGVPVAAFVHRAFWKGSADDGSAESYIGPVLQALEQRLTPAGIRYVGVGPVENFRARRWWRRSAKAARAVRPIEEFAPRTALAGSSGVWAARHVMRRAMLSSKDLRSAAIISGVDCWPVIAEALAGIALLQFPWSARAMDEAGAALDALRPDVAVTYAEAGGWGRALALEARRRNVSLAGLQHGFIYRHWLNYLHEPDEMEPLRAGSRDIGFPRPAVTLLFDEYAARHLMEGGRFPRESIAVTGSPRLDVVADTFHRLTDKEVDAARVASGAGDSKQLILLVTKYSEARDVLPALLKAVHSMPTAQLAVKTHPAETPDPYEAAARGQGNVRVLAAAVPLAPLLRAADAVVTVNSTVALDAMALGVPALTIGLPNNLSPFVEAGAIAGAAAPDEIGPALQRLLYDDLFRQQFRSASAAVAAAYGMTPSGDAADRQVSIILGLATPKP
jgi:Capsule polysaccharide biosynthesis protein